MNIDIQDEGDSGSGQAVAFTVQENEEVHVLHPQQIVLTRALRRDGPTGSWM